MSKPKTITLREHVAEMERMHMNYVQVDTRRFALEHAVKTQSERDDTDTIVKRAKAFEAYVTGKKARP